MLSFKTSFHKCFATLAVVKCLALAVSMAHAAPPVTDSARLIKPRRGGMVALNPQPIPPGRAAHAAGLATSPRPVNMPRGAPGNRPQIDPATRANH